MLCHPPCIYYKRYVLCEENTKRPKKAILIQVAVGGAQRGSEMRAAGKRLPARKGQAGRSPEDSWPASPLGGRKGRWTQRKGGGGGVGRAVGGCVRGTPAGQCARRSAKRVGAGPALVEGLYRSTGPFAHACSQCSVIVHFFHRAA